MRSPSMHDLQEDPASVVMNCLRNFLPSCYLSLLNTRHVRMAHTVFRRTGSPLVMIRPAFCSLAERIHHDRPFGMPEGNVTL